MIYKAYITKGTDDATDFENNHKSDAVEVSKFVINGTDFIKNMSYADFKSEVSDWTTVRYRIWDDFYELYLIKG